MAQLVFPKAARELHAWLEWIKMYFIVIIGILPREANPTTTTRNLISAVAMRPFHVSIASATNVFFAWTGRDIP